MLCSVRQTRGEAALPRRAGADTLARMTVTPTKLPAPHEEAFAAWQADPTPEKLDTVVKHLGPTIQGALRGMGSHDDPVMELKAKVLTSRAVRSYDPKFGAALPTWVARQMQPLRRFKRTALAPVRIPERIQMDALHVMQSEQEFRDKHQRDPDAEELADQARLSIDRIAKIKRTFRRVASQEAFGEGAPTAPPTDFSDESLSYVYHDADKIDRRIIEMKTGYGGNFEPMPPHEIARQLNLSPVQLSRRSARLGARLEEIRNALTSTNA